MFDAGDLSDGPFFSEIAAKDREMAFGVDRVIKRPNDVREERGRLVRVCSLLN